MKWVGLRWIYWSSFHPTQTHTHSKSLTCYLKENLPFLSRLVLSPTHAKFFVTFHKTVSGVVHSMQLYPLQEVLTAPYLVSEWRPDLIEELQTELSPHTCRIIVVGQKLAPTAKHTEKWYGTKYNWEKLDKNVLDVRRFHTSMSFVDEFNNFLFLFALRNRNGRIVVWIRNCVTRKPTRSYPPTSICIRSKRTCKRCRSSFTIRRWCECGTNRTPNF